MSPKFKQEDGFVFKNNNAFQKFNIDKNGQAFMKEKVTPVFQMALSEAKFVHDSLFVINPQFYGGSYMLMYDMKHRKPEIATNALIAILLIQKTLELS